jgi:hypothetical protein
MLLKTQVEFGKQTQNELKNEPNLGCLRREVMPNSEVARLAGKKPLTRLATLATLSPGARAFIRVRLQPSRESGETREKYKNQGNEARMSMKTKDKYKMSLSRAVSVSPDADRTPSGRRSEGGG